MKHKELFNQYFVIGITAFFIIISTVPIIESAPIKNEKRNEINYYLPLSFTSKMYFFGGINNLSVNGTNYFFGANNLRGLAIDGENLGNWHMSYFHYTGNHFIMIYDVHFRGILRPHFICGVFLL
ncbi:MAG: hypothetical protein IMZ43_06845 [Thermoplasmata archaeon]|nr:hypothetical protein [Thermoplasmata archaeon]